MLSDARLYIALLRIDREIAAITRGCGCPCGGRLHSADYPRKPRGGPAPLPDGYEERLSFCCARDGCRKRTTPPSVRFLGRKVYLGAIVVLSTAMQHGVTPQRAARLRALLGVHRHTIARWRQWWREIFAVTPFWQTARGLLSSPVTIGELPQSLLERFGAEDAIEQLGRMLRFIRPITTGSAGHVEGISMGV